MTTGSWMKTVCAITVLAAMLSGCGRKGDLDRPGVTAAPAANATETTPAPVKERRFILDGLLE